MSDTMNDGPNRSRRSDDPFAELADVIGHGASTQGEDASWAHRNAPPIHSGGRGTSAGFFEPAIDFEGAPYSRAAPSRANRSGEGGGSKLPERRPFYSEDEQSEFGAALLGLCEPAAPRISGPAETARVAPDRYMPQAESTPQSAAQDDFDELIASEMAVLRPQPAPPQEAYVDPFHDERVAYAAYVAQAHQAHVHADAAHTEAMHSERPVAREAPRQSIVVDGRGRRARLLGAGVAAVALIGMIGLFAGGALSGGGLVGGGEPVLIRADAEPVKMAPSDPGGRVVPNQNKAVYERVARNASTASGPSQGMLISAAEVPLDISFEDDVSDLPGVMVGATELPVVEDLQIAQAQSSPEADAVSSILQPHRVRTFEVRPDGTLVPRTDPAAAGDPTAFDPVEAAGQPAMPFSVEVPTQSAPGAAPAATLAPEPEAAPAAEPAAVAAVAPAAQPAPAVPSDAFFVQISSQPSEALARESMATLSNRFSSAIGGRQLSIQSAEIDGRGTFHRVRIVTASRDEANSVCANLQSAGGSCFVTR